MMASGMCGMCGGLWLEWWVVGGGCGLWVEGVGCGWRGRLWVEGVDTGLGFKGVGGMA